jgi:hypothetical protein
MNTAINPHIPAAAAERVRRFLDFSPGFHGAPIQGVILVLHCRDAVSV